jgi:site-specific DNA recombinase
MAQIVPVKLQKRAGKRTVIGKEAVRKTNNALIKAVVKAHLWKRQLEEGKHASVRELSTKINISRRHKKIKQSRYRPGVAQRVPGS